MNVGYTIPKAEENILAGIKIHTMREDKTGRYKRGVLLHHATGIRSKKYRCFLVNKCTGVQSAIIYNFEQFEIWIDGFKLSERTMKEFIKCDGFETIEDLKKWFFKTNGKKTEWTGKLIHWTDNRY